MAAAFHVFLQNSFSRVPHLQHILSPRPPPPPLPTILQVSVSSGALIIWLKPKAKESLCTVAMFLFYLLQVTREKFRSDAHVYNRTSYEDPVLSLLLLLPHKFVFQSCCCCLLQKTERWKRVTLTTSWSHKASLFLQVRKVS
jgi:hypothetical protein